MRKGTIVASLVLVVGFFGTGCTAFGQENDPSAKVYDVAITLQDNLRATGVEVSDVVRLGPSACKTTEVEGKESRDGVYWSASFSISPNQSQVEQVIQYTEDILKKKDADEYLIEQEGVSLTAGTEEYQYDLYPTFDLFNKEFNRDLSTGYFFEASTGCFPD